MSEISIKQLTGKNTANIEEVIAGFSRLINNFPTSSVTKFKCSVCGKLTSGRIPGKGRDIRYLSFRFPRRHNHNGNPCEGNILEAEWVNAPLK